MFTSEMCFVNKTHDELHCVFNFKIITDIHVTHNTKAYLLISFC